MREWNPHCIPPWEEGELGTIVENAFRYAQNPPGVDAVEPTAIAFGDAIALHPEWLEQKADPKRDRFYLEDEDEMELGKDPTWLIPDLIPDLATVLLVGATGSYKSFLALDIALSIASGTSSNMGVPTSHGPTIYAALEGRANIKKARRRAWKRARSVSQVKDFFVCVAPIIAQAGEQHAFADAIEAKLNGRKPRLIILDTLAKCMSGMDENNVKDAGGFIRFCDTLVEHFGCSVVAIHHTGKDESRGARGSSAFLAGFDTVIDVCATRSSKTVTVFVRKHKDADERRQPWHLIGKPVGLSLVFDPLTAAAYGQANAAERPYSPERIETALQLSGFASAGLNTLTLAHRLTKKLTEESASSFEARLNICIKDLEKLAKDELAGYVLETTPNLVWGIKQ